MSNASAASPEAPTRTIDASSTWTALLDVMEAGLDEFPPVVVDQLPADPGPLPPALQDRAVQLLRRMAEVETALDAARAEMARELTGLSAARTASAMTAAPNVPHFLDTRA
jgi:hypothetical protein